MTHREVYRWLLSPQQRDRLVRVLHEEHYVEKLCAEEVRFVEAEPEPYLSLTIRRGATFTAHSGGIYLDLARFPELEQAGWFYFPLVGLSDTKDAIARRHELQHLHDLLDLIERDPTYPDRSLRVHCNDELSGLEEQIDLEVFKVFTLEPPAFRLEYALGACTIEMPFLPGLTFPYRCDSADELVATWMTEYVRQLEQRFVQRFPGERARIREVMRRAVDREGVRVFGEGAFARVEALREDLPRRMLERVERGDVAWGGRKGAGGRVARRRS